MVRCGRPIDPTNQNQYIIWGRWLVPLERRKAVDNYVLGGAEACTPKVFQLIDYRVGHLDSTLVTMS